MGAFYRMVKKLSAHLSSATLSPPLAASSTCTTLWLRDWGQGQRIQGQSGAHLVLLHRRVHLPAGGRRQVVEHVEPVVLHKLLAEEDSPGAVAPAVQGGRPGGETHHVGDDDQGDPRHPGLGGQAHSEGELAAVVVHTCGSGEGHGRDRLLTAAVHEAEHAPDGVAVQDSLRGDRADSAVGQGGGHHRPAEAQ